MLSDKKEILWAATHSGVQTAAAGNNTLYHDRTIVLAPNIVVFFFDQYENTILLGSCNDLRSYQPTSCGCQGSVFLEWTIFVLRAWTNLSWVASANFCCGPSTVKVCVKFLTVLLMRKSYVRNVWIIKFLSICIDLILSSWSETHSSVKNSNMFNHENAE